MDLSESSLEVCIAQSLQSEVNLAPRQDFPIYLCLLMIAVQLPKEIIVLLNCFCHLVSLVFLPCIRIIVCSPSFACLSSPMAWQGNGLSFLLFISLSSVPPTCSLLVTGAFLIREQVNDGITCHRLAVMWRSCDFHLYMSEMMVWSTFDNALGLETTEHHGILPYMRRRSHIPCCEAPQEGLVL